MKMPHTACRRNKRVVIVLRDGERIKDTFVERTDSKIVVLGSGRRIRAGEIKSFRLARGGK